MKQDADKFTVDILTGKRGRGRPPAPHKPTEAERKAAYRAKYQDKKKTVTFTLSADLVEAFDAYLVNYRDKIGPITRDQALDRILRNQVMRKR